MTPIKPQPVRTLHNLLAISCILWGGALYAQEGAVDQTFDPGLGANLYILSTAIQPDGKILIGGIFTTYGGTAQRHIARLNPEGSLDTEFVTGSGPNDFVHAIALQTDGKILIGGEFESFNGASRIRIARLNSDGSLDQSFNPGAGLNSEVTSFAVQSDEKILVGGIFGITRLNSDGSLDSSFDPGSGVSGMISCVALQPDGRIIIGGIFSDYDGTFRNNIARLNVDGSLDMTFDPGTGTDGANGAVVSALLQPDGKVVIGGNFNWFDGVQRNHITRLNADGSLDFSFDPGTGTSAMVTSALLHPTGKIILGGLFTTYNGIGRNHLLRVNPNGELDTSFDPGAGANYEIHCLSFQFDGKIVIGGNFTSYDDLDRNRIARVLNDFTTSVTYGDDQEYLILPNPSPGILNIPYNDQGHGSIIVTDIAGKLVLSERFQVNGTRSITIDLSHHPPGTYLVTVYGSMGTTTQRLIIQ